MGAGYFAAMGTVLLRGREFAASDREGAAPVAIINQTMADQFWPGQDAVGRRLFEGKPGKGDSYEIVGVVENGKYRAIGENSRPVVFRSRFQHPRPRSTFVAHVRGDSQAALGAIREVTRALDPRLSFSRLGTLEQHLSLALFPARTTGLLFSMFGAVALWLAVSGLFCVIAYSVSQRTREIGVRVALGASRRNVMRMVLCQGLKLAGQLCMRGKHFAETDERSDDLNARLDRGEAVQDVGEHHHAVFGEGVGPRTASAPGSL